MGAIAIREKLHEYIRTADDKKVKAIFTIVENDIEQPYEWWKDKKLIDQMDKDVAEYKSGKQRGYTWEEVNEKLLNTKKRKLNK